MKPNSSDAPRLYAVSVETGRAFAAHLDELLPRLGVPAASWHEEDRDRARVEVFCRTRRRAARLLDALRPVLAATAGGAAWSASLKELPREDWAESWKRFFRTRRVSPRIVVRPSWQPARSGPGDCVIAMDPGMSFGTGQHATTRGCLRLLDAGAPRPGTASFLDIGCGSGILAIAAAKLGFREIAAIDNDPAAIRCARANARANGVSGAIAFRVADFRRRRARRAYDVVAANLLGPLLVEGAAALVRTLSRRPAARLIASGLLAGQEAEVRRAFAACGLHPRDRVAQGGWVTLAFSRNGRPRRRAARGKPCCR